MALINRINDRLSLMGESMARTGALENPNNLGFATEYRRATTSCLFCKHGAACKDFLEATADSDKVPGFCPNIATFERMKHG